MLAQLSLFPKQASTTADQVDKLFLFLLVVTGLAALAISASIFFFAVKYRRGTGLVKTPRILGSTLLETSWSVIPMLIFLVMFVWGAEVYFSLTEPPADAMNVYVVGRQWMWKIQHPEGQREINTLHVPVDTPVKLTLTSEDVIHDFFVPEFRTHVDVLPGRYVQTWFQANRVGTYHLFCSQYCGTSHAQMIGTVVVMEKEKYGGWLNSNAEGSLALKGRKLFLKMQCVTCHSSNARARAPVLEGLYGTTVHLEDGRQVVADEAYIRRSILQPKADIVEGWKPIMPTFEGQLADESSGLDQEETLIQLIAYIKSLKPGDTPVRTEEFPPPIGGPTSLPSEKGPTP